MIRVILWDIDNTLLSFNKAEVAAFTREFQEFGIGEFTEELLKDYSVINKSHLILGRCFYKPYSSAASFVVCPYFFEFCIYGIFADFCFVRNLFNICIYFNSTLYAC